MNNAKGNTLRDRDETEAAPQAEGKADHPELNCLAMVKEVQERLEEKSRAYDMIAGCYSELEEVVKAHPQVFNAERGAGRALIDLLLRAARTYEGH